MYHTVCFVDDEILSFVQLYILWNQFVCVRDRDGERERERGGYYPVLVGKAYWNMLVPQHPILLHNHMIVMLNESNLPVYTCNDSDQNKLAQSDTMYYTTTHSDSCSKTTENRSITWAVTDQIVPRSASPDRKEIRRDTGRDNWRVTPSSDYKPQGVVCWTGAPIPKALYHTLCWLYCQWYTHNYMLASSEPKTIIALALTLKWPIHANAGHKNSVKVHGISLAKLQQLLSGLFK